MNWSIEEFNLGSITAFGDAKIGGFSGTKEQFYSLIKKVARGAYLIDIDKSTATLDSGDWSNNQYDLTSVYPTNKYKIFSVTLDYDNATSSQIDAWNNGDIALCDGNILKALGNVPLVDLPIVVVFQGLIIAVEVPVLSGSLVFDGTEQTPTFTGYDPNAMIMGGDTAETNAGDYTAAFTPRTGYMWSDGTTGVKFVPWSIAKAVVTAPTVTANLTYDGTEQTATVSEYDSDLVSVTGITGTNAGTYTATIALIDKANSEWDDHSTDDITETWTIAKAQGYITLSSNTVTIDENNPTATVTILTHSGTVSASSSDISIATVSISGDSILISGVNQTEGNVTITVQTTETSNYSASSGAIFASCYVDNTRVYGVYWSGGKSPIWTREDDAENFGNPIPYYSGMADTPSSPFDDIQPWAGMQISERTGGTMVSIPKFYYKITRKNNSFDLKIAPASNGASWAVENGFVVSPAHRDRDDGVGERDVVYIGRYHCASDYKSKTGVTPKVKTTRTTFRNGIHALGSNIWQNDYAIRITIWMLYLVEFANWNSQSMIGYGCGNNSSVGTMGYTDSMPYHTGTTRSSKTQYGLGTQYRNIEGLWDNCYDVIDGVFVNVLSNSKTLYAEMNPSNYSSNSYTSVATFNTVANTISAMATSSISSYDWVWYPSSSESGTNYIQYVCDTITYNPNVTKNGLYFGGSWYQQLNSGLFCMSGSNYEIETTAFGSRIMELPNNT